MISALAVVVAFIVFSIISDLLLEGLKTAQGDPRRPQRGAGKAVQHIQKHRQNNSFSMISALAVVVKSDVLSIASEQLSERPKTAQPGPRRCLHRAPEASPGGPKTKDRVASMTSAMAVAAQNDLKA